MSFQDGRGSAVRRTKPPMANILLSTVILLLSLLLSLVIQQQFQTQALIPAIFVLAVYLISLLTDGYLYGFVSALASMMMVNYAFTFPYFKFNFSIPANAINAVILIIVTLVTSMLTTQLKRQEALRLDAEREKMRANLLRAISHDLRTPLTTIYGASSAIIDNYESFSDEQKKQMITSIREDSFWLNRMVENLLSVTRIDGGGLRLIRTPVAVDELVDSVLVKFRKRYPDQAVELSLPEEVCVIPMDATLIEQVLINLLENAMQHAEGMTKLSLGVHPDGEFAVFEVTDDGCGIEPDRLRDLFTGAAPLKAPSADSRPRNAGIGLSVCRTIVRAHGGDIEALNLHCGGALFRFTLSLKEDP